jgi:Penicillin V acylase and related amidases
MEGAEIMQEKIEHLYETINFLGFNATYSRNNNYAKNAREMIPQIQEFVQWFLTNISGLEEGVYLNLIDILKDCETALQEDDNVLMMDALEQGLSEYLEMFLSEEYFKEKESGYVDGNAKSES